MGVIVSRDQDAEWEIETIAEYANQYATALEDVLWTSELDDEYLSKTEQSVDEAWERNKY